MIRRTILLLIIGLFAVPASWAQNRSKLSRKELMESKSYFLDAAKKHSKKEHPEAYVKTAMNLYRAGKRAEALPYFQTADSLGMLTASAERFAYFDCLKSQKRYPEADRFISDQARTDSQNNLFNLNAGLGDRYERISSYRATRIYNLKANSPNSEFGPALYGDLLYFTSSRPAPGNRDVHRLNMQPYFNLYATPFADSSGQIMRPSGRFGAREAEQRFNGVLYRSLPAGVNLKYHDGPVFVSKSGTHMFVTTNWQGKRFFPNNERLRLNIFHSVKKDSTWSELVPVPFNQKSWTTQHAAFDEFTSTLYFSSNRPGGLGGFDLWSAQWVDGKWSEARNLGPHVNTPRNEVFPGLAPDGGFVFSSDGWPGLGGLDVFLSDDPLRNPINMLSLINSPADDFGLTFLDSASGFMVSNRVGSKGDDDLWRYTLNLNDIRAENGVPVPIWIRLEYSGLRPSELANVEIRHADSVRLIALPKDSMKVRVMVPEGALVTVRALGFMTGSDVLDREEIRKGVLVMPMRPVDSTVVAGALVRSSAPVVRNFDDLSFNGWLGSLVWKEATIKRYDSAGYRVTLADGQRLQSTDAVSGSGDYVLSLWSADEQSKQVLRLTGDQDSRSAFELEVDPSGGPTQGWRLSFDGVLLDSGSNAPSAGRWYQVRLILKRDSVLVRIDDTRVTGVAAPQAGYASRLFSVTSKGISRLDDFTFIPKPVDSVVHLATLYFQYGRPSLNRHSRLEADRMIDHLNQDRKAILNVSVDNSCTGPMEADPSLNERRVTWLARYFETRLAGSSSRIVIGKTQPLHQHRHAPCHKSAFKDDCSPSTEQSMVHLGIRALISYNENIP